MLSGSEHFIFETKPGKFFLTAKAGFDFTERGISVDLNEAGDKFYRVRVLLPTPKLLSFETERYEVVKSESGWWNEITAQDLETAVNAMQEEARVKTVGSSILQEAKVSSQERINHIIHEARAKDFQFEVEYVWAEESFVVPSSHLDSLARPR